MKYAALLTTVIILLAGCADTHQTQNLVASGTRLSPGDAVYIGISADGVYGDQNYAGSGLTTSQILKAAFLQWTDRVKVAEGRAAFQEAIEAGRGLSYDYLVYPTILHWEDRATEWSGIPDRVEVKVVLVDLATGQTLESAIIKGKSGLATFGGDHPQDLLPGPMTDFVATLYR